MDPVYYLDGDNSVLCSDCAEDSREDFIERFRPVSGPHANPVAIDCDQCSRMIPDVDGNTDYPNGEEN